MTPAETVDAFLKLQSVSKESLHKSFELYFTTDTIWENVGLSRTQGIEEAKHVLDTSEKMGIETIDVETLHQISDDHIVLNERIDHLMDKDKKELLALRIMGIFEVTDGKIVSWRDYFDTAALRPPQ